MTRDVQGPGCVGVLDLLGVRPMAELLDVHAAPGARQPPACRCAPSSVLGVGLSPGVDVVYFAANVVAYHLPQPSALATTWRAWQAPCDQWR